VTQVAIAASIACVIDVVHVVSIERAWKRARERRAAEALGLRRSGGMTRHGASVRQVCPVRQPTAPP
jgi:hypothetical protein